MCCPLTLVSTPTCARAPRVPSVPTLPVHTPSVLPRCSGGARYSAFPVQLSTLLAVGDLSGDIVRRNGEPESKGACSSVCHPQTQSTCIAIEGLRCACAAAADECSRKTALWPTRTHEMLSLCLAPRLRWRRTLAVAHLDCIRENGRSDQLSRPGLGKQGCCDQGTWPYCAASPAGRGAQPPAFMPACKAFFSLPHDGGLGA